MVNLTIEDLKRIIKIGTMLSSESNINKLLNAILTEARKITNCDAGTLYLVNEKQLVFTVMHNDTMKSYSGVDGNPPTLPPVQLLNEDTLPNLENVSAYVANNAKAVIIDDVYNAEKFNFEGTKKYDEMTGYRTMSMIVLPLRNSYAEVIGVLQLINAKNQAGETVPFESNNIEIVKSLSSQAAIAVANVKYLEEIHSLFRSFVVTMTKSIDERSPYTANHTKKIAEFAEKLVDYGIENNKLDIDRREGGQVVMAAWLHDVGKIATDLSVMDKMTRLGTMTEPVKERLYMIAQQKELVHIKGEISAEEFETLKAELVELDGLIDHANATGFMEDDIIERIEELGERTYINRDGESVNWLSEFEIKNLSIKKGTLTADERKIMEHHVVSTANILENIKFTREYDKVAEYASSHHEFLDGSGYPKGLKAHELSQGQRILTVLDIFEALTAMDRPYKKGMPVEKALSILDAMVREGKIDEHIVELLKESKIWES